MTWGCRWRLAGIFLLIAYPLLLANWWLSQVPLAVTVTNRTELVYLLAPVLAAAVSGMVWRRHIPTTPDRAARQSLNWLIGSLLFAAMVIAPFLAEIWSLRRGGAGWDEVVANYPDIALIAVSPIPALIRLFVFAFTLMICLVQTEVGLSLGIWLMGHLMKRA